MIRTTATLLAGLAMLLIAESAVAHQVKAAITTVLFNKNSQNLEVMHRFNLHDAEHAVKQILGKDADIIASQQTRQQFSDYVNQRFAMYDENGNTIGLTAVGFEIDGKHFWVYQETAEPPQLRNMTIQHNALRELWPTQVNTLNIEGKGNIKTLTFDENVELLSVEF